MSSVRSLLLAGVVAVATFAAPPALAKGDGEEMLETFIKEKALIDDEKLVAYVRAVGNRVAAQAHRPDLHFQFNVVDDASVNAMALEDGYVFVHRGLLAYLDREDQLAAVLGHEIGHVVLRHVATTKRSQFLTQLAAFAAGILTWNYDIQQVVAAYGAERITGFGREHELEADHVGAEYAMAAGYDPQAMIEVVQILKDQDLFAKRVTGQNTTYHALFASHPRNDQRLQQAVASVGVRATDTVAEPVDDYLARIEGLTWGNAGEAGALRGQSYYHGRLGFVLEAPAGWQLTETSAKLTAYMPGGATQGFVSMEMDGVRDGHSPEDTVVKVLKPGQLKDGEKLDIKDGEKTMAGYLATVVQPLGTQGISLIAVIHKDGRAHVFRAETRDPAAVDDLRKGMRFMLEHLRTITYADLKVANTERIALYEAQPGDTYESLAQHSPIPANAANELRLLNGDFPNGQPRAGDRVKVVR